MILAAIDPGIKGGIAFLDTETNQLWAERTPIIAVRDQHGKDTRKRLFDRDGAAALFAQYRPTRLVVEDVKSRNGEGVTSAFTFGRDLGAWLGIAAVYGIKPEFVVPSVWKKALGLTQSKSLSLELARKLYPDNADDFVYATADDGRAEAALLIHFTLEWDKQKAKNFEKRVTKNKSA